MPHMSGVFRIGNEPAVRYTQGGDAVLGLSLAANYGQKGQDGKRPTQWFDCSLWGKRAESLAQYLTKGSQVYVVLSDVHIETFQGRDGNTGSKIVARVSDIELIGGQQQGQPQAHGSSASDYARQTGRDPSNVPPPPRRQEPPRGASYSDDLDSEIPF